MSVLCKKVQVIFYINVFISIEKILLGEYRLIKTANPGSLSYSMTSTVCQDKAGRIFASFYIILFS